MIVDTRLNSLMFNTLSVRSLIFFIILSKCYCTLKASIIVIFGSDYCILYLIQLDDLINDDPLSAFSFLILIINSAIKLKVKFILYSFF